MMENSLLHEDLYQESVTGPDGSSMLAVYLPLYYHSEVGAAELLRSIVDGHSSLTGAWKVTKWPQFLADLARKNDVSLTDQQQGVVQKALKKSRC